MVDAVNLGVELNASMRFSLQYVALVLRTVTKHTCSSVSVHAPSALRPDSNCRAEDAMNPLTVDLPITEAPSSNALPARVGEREGCRSISISCPLLREARS